jgi:hypothetical protein
LLAAGLASDADIETLRADVDAAVARGVQRSTTIILADAIGEIPD